MCAAQRPQRAPAQALDVPAAEQDGARRGQEPQQRQAERGLARAALADDAQRLALAHGEADAVDRLDVADRPPQQAALDREVDLDVPPLRPRPARRGSAGGGAPLGSAPAGGGCRGAAGAGEQALDRGGLDRSRPPCMTQTRSAILRTIVRSWVMSSTAMPSRRCRSCEELEDLRLDGDVERRRRLVGDQDVGLVGERHRDHDPLPLPARELVRVGGEPRLGVRDPDEPQQLERARRGRRRGPGACGPAAPRRSAAPPCAAG